MLPQDRGDDQVEDGEADEEAELANGGHTICTA